MIQNAIPILPATNLRATIDFFENNLGFTAVNIGTCVVLKNGGAEIQLEFIGNKNKPLHATASCCLYVNNIEDLFARLSARDMITSDGKLRQTVFGIKEFSVKDNNGNTIHFREQKQTD